MVFSTPFSYYSQRRLVRAGIATPTSRPSALVVPKAAHQIAAESELRALLRQLNLR